MIETWLTAAPSILIGVAILVVPGAVVVASGWGVRSLRAWLFAPALSVALLAVAATLAPFVGLTWSPLPVAALTVIAAAVAMIVRRSTRPSGRDATASSGRAAIAAGAALVLAIGAITVQLIVVFGAPENISQTFDNVIHLNAIALALETGDASVFAIGRTSDIAVYPNGWHAVVTLVAQLGGGTIPLAVSASNIAICAVAWPTSVLALAATVFRERPAALLLSGALSTGFGAFPLLLMDFGVLYPNATAYAILPAGVAAVCALLWNTDRLRSALLLLCVAAGIGLAHPNAFLALYAMTAVAVIVRLLRGPRGFPTWRGLATTAAVMLLGVVIWRFGRTNTEMSTWREWQSTAQALGEAALVSPAGYPITIVTSLLLVLGMVAVVRNPRRWLHVAIPFAAASFLFVVASGLSKDSTIRDVLTNPWYNDSYRLAALLPTGGIPVAVVGALLLFDLVAVWWRRAHWPEPARVAVVVAASVALFAVAFGTNVRAVARQAHEAYRMDNQSLLLTADERKLLERLDETTPEDATLIVNPWTGGSLAYPLADREVVERHIFSVRTPDEVYVDENLANIEHDPEVCDAVTRLGADYVLDFGDQNVFDDPSSGTEREGLNDLEPSSHLVLVDEEGSDARLFQIVGCE